MGNASDYGPSRLGEDKDPVEREAFEQLKTELSRAFAAPDGSYMPVAVDAVIARNRMPH